MKKILFAVSSLWLWHATRSLVLIKQKLKEWYSIDIISFWNALNYLKNELEWFDIDFMELQDYPALERWKWMMFYFYLISDLITTKKIIKQERNFVKKIENKYNKIYSDWRYWVYSKKIDSYLISHQLSFIMPKWLELFWKFSDMQNIAYFKNFTKVLIPDFEEESKSLAWRLSHPSWINKINHEYIWILSDFDKNYNTQDNKKIDFLFTITWYLQEHKKSFIDILIKKSKKIPWKKIFVLWDTSKKYIKDLWDNITIYSYVDKQEKKHFFQNADIIISRAGYTTIMDLVKLNKKAVLFPTPNQTEQEYLADYLKNKWLFVIWKNPNNLLNLVDKIKKC